MRPAPRNASILSKDKINLVNIKDKDRAISEIIANAPPAAKYPQAGALILFCDEKVEITPDNTEVSDLHYVIKILNDRGKQDFSESQIEYDSTYEKVELEYARTIKPDGTIVEVGTRHIRDVSKYLNFPLYSNVRVHIISFPEITEGAVAEYKLKVYRSQLVNKKDFVLDYPVQTKEPILQADFSVTLPAGRALKIETLDDAHNNFHANLTPSIQEIGGRTVYRWQFKDIPQIVPEPNMPPNVEINPTMLLATFENWQDIYNWWWALAKDKIKADAAITGKVKELLRNRPGGEDRVRAIYNFCAQEIRYVAVEYGQAGYEPHYAADIFKNKYGDCKDQAILLVTMLKEAGFTAWPVLIPTKDCYNLNPDFPSMLFDHCIAAVSLEGKTVFLDPTAQTCSFGDLPPVDQRRRVAVFKEDGYLIQETPLYEAAHNLIRQALSININPDETIAAEKSVFSHGVYDQAQRYWLLFTPPELIEQTLTEKIQEVSIGAKLKSYNIANLNDLNEPVVLSYAFQGPEYLTMGGDLRILPQLADVDSSLVAKEKRDFAIDFGFLDAKETVTEIQIPANFTVRYLPQDIDEDNQWLKFKVAYSHKGNKIIFRQDAELKQTVIPVTEYADFKSFFAGLAKKVKQRIILEKVK